MAIATGPALAANLPVSAAPRYTPPPPPPLQPPAFGWTGFYVGLNAGGTWSGHNSADVASTPIQNFNLGTGDWGANSAAGATGSVPVGGGAGFIGGAQIGYNWQTDRAWLLGFETDIQGGADQHHNGALATRTGPFPFFGAGEIITTDIGSSKRLDYLGTVRGRLGFLFTPTLLLYGTGGLAYGEVKAGTSITQSNNNCIVFPATCVQPFASTAGVLSGTRTGWTAGGGVEWKFAQQWSAKAEYLFYDLGSATFNNGTLMFGNNTFPGAGGPVVITSQSRSEFDGHIVRVGVNYHF
jgi:outer membrane immunogenic protein